MTNNGPNMYGDKSREFSMSSDLLVTLLSVTSDPNHSQTFKQGNDSWERQKNINRDVSEHTFDGYHISCGEHPSIISWYVLPRELCTSRKEALSKAAFWPPLRLLFNAAKSWTVNGGWLLQGLNPNISGEIGEMLFLSMSVFGLKSWTHSVRKSIWVGFISRKQYVPPGMGRVL